MRTRTRVLNITPGISPPQLAWGPEFGIGSSLLEKQNVDLSQLNISAENIQKQQISELSQLNLEGFSQNQKHTILFDQLDLHGSLNNKNVISGTLELLGMLTDEDTYLARDAGDSAGGGGSVILLGKNNTAVANDDKKTYLAWDLTGISPGSLTSATITLYMAENGVGNQTGSLQFFTNSAKPFEEDTATWNANEPPPGTQRQSFVQGISGADPLPYTFSLGSFARGNMLGSWCYMRVLGTSDGLGVNTISTWSKEANTGSQPFLNLTIVL